MFRATALLAVNSATLAVECLACAATDDNAAVFELFAQLTASEGVLGENHYERFAVVKNPSPFGGVRAFPSPQEKAANEKKQKQLQAAELTRKAEKAEADAKAARDVAKEANTRAKDATEAAKAAKAALEPAKQEEKK